MTTYEIPVGLLNDLIMAIIGSILAIGAYMIVWAIADAKHKTAVIGRLKHLEELIEIHDSYRAAHDIYTHKVDVLEQRVQDLFAKKDDFKWS